MKNSLLIITILVSTFCFPQKEPQEFYFYHFASYHTNCDENKVYFFASPIFTCILERGGDLDIDIRRNSEQEFLKFIEINYTEQVQVISACNNGVFLVHAFGSGEEREDLRFGRNKLQLLAERRNKALSTYDYGISVNYVYDSCQKSKNYIQESSALIQDDTKEQIADLGAEIIGNTLYDNQEDAVRFTQNVRTSRNMITNLENRNYVGAAGNLISLFTNSKRRQGKTMSQEEMNRLKKLEKERRQKENLSNFKSGASKMGMVKYNDTVMIRVGEGEKMIMNHNPLVAGGAFEINSIRTYNLETDEILTESIIEQRHSNGVPRVSKNLDYTKAIFQKMIHDSDEKVIKVFDLITDEIVYDESLSIRKDIKNNKGKKIGKKIIFNDMIHQEQYFGKKKFIDRAVFYYNGVKNQEMKFVLQDGKSVPTTVIDYDNKGQIARKKEASAYMILNNERDIILYKDGVPDMMKKYKNGILIKETKL